VSGKQIKGFSNPKILFGVLTRALDLSKGRIGAGDARYA
jgi:hypothetical protein